MGDRVDFQVATPEVTCTYRLTITAVPPVTPGTPRVFGFASRSAGPPCDLPIDQLNGWSDGHARYSLFRWHPGAGAPAAVPWNQCSPTSWARGAGTHGGAGYLEFEIPPGVTLMQGVELAPEAPAAVVDEWNNMGPDTAFEIFWGWVRTTLCDPATGSSITFDGFDGADGAEVARVVHPPAGDAAGGAALHALFDQIAASVREWLFVE